MRSQDQHVETEHVFYERGRCLPGAEKGAGFGDVWRPCLFAHRS